MSLALRLAKIIFAVTEDEEGGGRGGGGKFIQGNSDE
jgi:acetylornithine deacetylase/succinyl-diaminopimelate desuccinylase-like protein